MSKCLGMMLAGLMPLFFTACMQTFLKEHRFEPSRALEVNGAQVRSALKPMGGSSGFSFSAMLVSAASATLEGPFIWRIEAEGEEGVHEWLRVNEIRVTTEKTKRSEPYPKDRLGFACPFVPLPREDGKSFAKFQLPGKLTVFPEKDGRIKIHAHVSVKADGRTRSEWLLFELNPETKRRNETLFLPAEIVKSFQGNPREWDW